MPWSSNGVCQGAIMDYQRDAEDARHVICVLDVTSDNAFGQYILPSKRTNEQNIKMIPSFIPSKMKTIQYASISTIRSIKPNASNLIIRSVKPNASSSTIIARKTSALSLKIPTIKPTILKSIIIIIKKALPSIIIERLYLLLQ